MTIQGCLEILDRLTDENKRDSKPSKKRNKKTKKKSGEIKGVGFGGNQRDESQIKASMIEASSHEKQRDTDICNVLKQIKDEISKFHDMSSIFDALHTSESFMDMAQQLLRNSSLLDIGNRRDVYQSLLNLLTEIAREPFLTLLLENSSCDEEEDGLCSNQNANNVFETSLLGLLNGLATQASVFVSLHQRGSNGDGDIEDALTMALHIMSTKDECSIRLKQAHELGLNIPHSNKKKGSNKLGKRKLALADLKSDIKQGRKRDSCSSTKHDEEDAALYRKVLGPLRFQAIPLVASILNGTAAHSLVGGKGKAEKFLTNTVGRCGIVGSSQKFISRVGNEMSSMVSSLPIEYGSSIFVRCDEDRMDILKALIIGPEGTPYANGCFEFDILLPGDYPQRPPSVKLVTTGGGRVRFNPNLYNCGKVCLSLLGTWEGPSWDPMNSTILQVLVSIQSLILVPDPYFNEPGYERDMGTDRGKKLSEAYNARVRQDTLRVAILDQIKSFSSSVFQDVIIKHFQLKRGDILEQLNAWGQKGKMCSSTVLTELEQLNAWGGKGETCSSTVLTVTQQIKETLNEEKFLNPQFFTRDDNQDSKCSSSPEMLDLTNAELPTGQNEVIDLT